jgi:hypothetical protein
VVTASSTPTLQPPRVRPVSFAAPAMVVSWGASMNSKSWPPKPRCGFRPIRRVWVKLYPFDELYVRIEPKPKMLAPSTKNGRRSGKKVSNALRFTTAGSTSTWPKSGLKVALSVRLLVMPYFTSSPTPGATWFRRRNGSSFAAVGCSFFASAYGTTSICRGAGSRPSPERCP